VSEINLSWSGVSVTVTQDFLDQMEISKAMQKSQAFRDYRVARAIELAQRNLEVLEADGESEEVNFLLSQYIGELYSWQLDGETVDPEVKKD
jgi:hypothetical protein|tara:strand:+ start:1042 stop:1317 length:276 start_codon:yes stop_codon:yes gene_type:complete